MTIDFKTDIKLPYVDTDNALELLETVVNNGQTRLSLEVLMDVLISMVNKIEELDETVNAIVEALSEDEPQAPIEKVVEQKPVEQKVQEETKSEVKPVQKAKAEDKKVDTEEK